MPPPSSSPAPSPPASAATRRTIVASVVVLLLLAAFVALLWASGLLTFDRTAPSADVVAAALALVGAFLAALVSLVGLFVKHAADAQAEQRLALEAERNAALQREAEDRLKLETAVRAVQLLATDDGKPTPRVQHAGALFTLANLGQHDLLLSLATELIATDAIDAGTAARVLDHVLRRGERAAQVQAASLLSDQVERFLTPQGFEFPQCLLDGGAGLPTYAREWGSVALGALLAARPLADWQTRQESANAAVAALALMRDEERDTDVHNDIGAILGRLLRAFPDVYMLCHPLRAISFAPLRKELEGREAVRTGAQAVVARLDVWRGASEAGVALASVTVAAHVAPAPPSLEAAPRSTVAASP